MDIDTISRFNTSRFIEKSINSLSGFVEGIAIDGVINEVEIDFFKIWISNHEVCRNYHPYNELIPVLEDAISDGVLSLDERQDIRWLCERLQSAEYWNEVTAGIHRLHGILGGIASDAVISKAELDGLADWLTAHQHLRSCWPFDEIDSLVISVLADGKIDANEHKMLMGYFTDFVSILDDRTITRAPINEGRIIGGLCAVDPQISFNKSQFCFTGKSSRFSKSELAMIVETLGGQCISGVTQSTNYLVVGADGNPSWAFACYGRKVEKAVELRKKGFAILIVHENDFHDAVADLRVA